MDDSLRAGFPGPGGAAAGGPDDGKPASLRLAATALTVILLVLAGISVLSAAITYNAGRHATAHAQINWIMHEVHAEVAHLEALTYEYWLRPSVAVRAEYEEARQRLDALVAEARAKGGSPENLDAIAARAAAYQESVRRLFTAIDDGAANLANAIHDMELDARFHALHAAVTGKAQTALGNTVSELSRLEREQWQHLVATPMITAIGLATIALCWRIARRLEDAARASLAREALAARLGEQRFRALAQNTTDVILICNASGTMTYVTPAAEGAWGIPAAALVGQSFAALVSPPERPALESVWTSVAAEGGAQREVEVRLTTALGAAREHVLVLTNLIDSPAVGGIVITARDVTDHRALNRQLTQQAFYDPLTGLPNHALLLDRAGQALVRARLQETSVVAIMLDLRDFKKVNVSLGHAAGDRVLCAIAQRLRARVRSESTVARLAGDQFVVLVEHMSGETALLKGEMLRLHLSQPLDFDGLELTIAPAIGIAVSDPDGGNAEGLLRKANVALNHAKAMGGEACVLFDASMEVDGHGQLSLEADLRRAVEREELRVFYQPIVSLEDGTIVEVEALVRWQHPTRGLVSPATFIPVAEATGLIVPIGRWVMEQACRQGAIWNTLPGRQRPLAISVNLSPLQFRQQTLLFDVEQALATSALPPDCLKIEITESAMMTDAEATIATLTALKLLGVRLAVDDFGTGYSSLAYLKRLPLDVIKVDRSFVGGIGQAAEDAAIVKAIIGMAKALNLSVTVEGVETLDQATLLTSWDCERAQGFLFSRPVEPARMEALLRDGVPLLQAAA